MDSILVCFKTKIIEIQKVIAQTFYSKVEVILCGYHAPRRAALLIMFTLELKMTLSILL